MKQAANFIFQLALGLVFGYLFIASLIGVADSFMKPMENKTKVSVTQTHNDLTRIHEDLQTIIERMNKYAP